MLLVFLVILNFAISYFNAWSVGRVWPETRAVGGLSRFMAWTIATMSACGFTWVYSILLAFGLNAVGWLPAAYAQGLLEMGYLLIIVPILASGLVMTISSWAYFWRRRTLGSGVVAGWNTFAQVLNTYQAISAVPAAFSHVTRLLKGGDKKASTLMVVAVIFAACGGILTTAAVIRRTAKASATRMAERFGRLGETRAA
jgi:hypothetical protein